MPDNEELDRICREASGNVGYPSPGGYLLFWAICVPLAYFIGVSLGVLDG